MTSLPIDAPDTTAASGAPRLDARTVTAVSIGTFVEWFDFALYGFSAVVLAKAFFPAGSSAVLAALAVYGVSFLARPIGGIVFGRIGDRRGRRTALTISLVLMGCATAGIGVIPGFHTIGWFAPALLVLCRLVQGFAASSELTGAAAYLAESSSPGRRGLMTNVVSAFGSIGTAGATVLILIFDISPTAYADGGWRWSFVAGGLIAVGGLYLRLRLAETDVFQRRNSTQRIPGLGELVRKHLRLLLVLVAFYALAGIGFQTLVGYMPTYMTAVVGIDSRAALLISLLAVLSFAASVILCGWLTDRVGRKPVMIGGAIGIVVLTVPAYALMGVGNIPLMCLAQVLLIVPVGALQAGGNIANCEVFPPAVRYSAMALSYTVSYAVFAGTAPLIDAALQSGWGGVSPAFYGVLIALIGLPILIMGYPESRRFSIDTGAATLGEEAV